ncbi:MAG: hypothetical protein ACTHMA_22055, partial [Thermomicrobiales bacterium]
SSSQPSKLIAKIAPEIGRAVGQWVLVSAVLVSRATDLSALNSELPIYVEDVQVREGRLALTGRPK